MLKQLLNMNVTKTMLFLQYGFIACNCCLFFECPFDKIGIKHSVNVLFETCTTLALISEIKKFAGSARKHVTKGYSSLVFCFFEFTFSAARS